MDILSSLKNDPGTLFGALLTGGLWALYAIYDKLIGDSRNRRQQAGVDKGTTELIASLRTDRDEANQKEREEQERADRFARENMELSIDLGGLRADLRHSQEARAELKEKLDRATAHIEQLVVEIRNKDRSITELVKQNRQILRAIGSSPETPEGVQLEKRHGTQRRPEVPDEPS
jgi:chromosome segregation ATPase